MSIVMANSMMNKTLPDLSKLEPLDGKNYKRWSQKLLIFFEQLEIDYVLYEDVIEAIEASKAVAPDPSLSAEDVKKAAEALTKKEKDNKLVRAHILHHVNGILFDLLITNRSSKSIWDTLQKKYGADDAGKKKYVVGKWINFKMTDDKSIMDQVHDYENIVTDILGEGMKMCETLQANVLLEKFPPSWNDYRNSLKHKKKDMNLQELIGHMRTEEANRLKDKFESLSLNSSKANLVESSAPMAKNRFKGKKKNHSTKGNFTNNHKIQKDQRSLLCVWKDRTQSLSM
ncbi:uncharacterized protein [Spinacia oleracea]|uniref:Ty1-copia retrotransposon protein n=1 Tax=Spinacia oleracea TaxID=3562 RepID=A0ABM3QZB1_SPIOL|nr:uncharacterized protein LOC130463580 [Spinacia oleracea]